MEKVPNLVTHPLGLAGYALALVFGLIGKLGPSDRFPWLLPAALAMAAICVIGGLLLAKGQITAQAAKAKKPVPVAATASVTQTTLGEQSPAIANTGGDVNVNYGAPPKKKP